MIDFIDWALVGVWIYRIALFASLSIVLLLPPAMMVVTLGIAEALHDDLRVLLATPAKGWWDRVVRVLYRGSPLLGMAIWVMTLFSTLTLMMYYAAYLGVGDFESAGYDMDIVAQEMVDQYLLGFAAVADPAFWRDPLHPMLVYLNDYIDDLTRVEGIGLVCMMVRWSILWSIVAVNLYMLVGFAWLVLTETWQRIPRRLTTA